MGKLPKLGYYLFALGMLGIGVEHFIYGDFLLGRAPSWPAGWPGQLVWAYLSGGFFVLAGIGLFVHSQVRQALALAALLVLVWSLVRHVPVLAAGSLFSGAWTTAGKALVFFSGALAVGARYTAGGVAAPRFLWRREKQLLLLGRICLGLFLLVCGIQHFLFEAFVASLLPSWFPGAPLLWSRFAGVALIAGGLGLWIPSTARLAALLSGWMIFSWVWLVHVPRIGVSISDNIAVFEALAFSGVAWVLAED